MAHIVTAVLVVDGDGWLYDSTKRDELVATVNLHMRAEWNVDAGICPIAHTFGGRSLPRAAVFGVACDAVELQDLADFLRSLPWAKGDGVRRGDVVQLVVRCEYDAGVRLVDIHGSATIGCCSVGARA